MQPWLSLGQPAGVSNNCREILELWLGGPKVPCMPLTNVHRVHGTLFPRAFLVWFTDGAWRFYTSGTGAFSFTSTPFALPSSLSIFSIKSSFGKAILASCLFSSVCSVAELTRAAASRAALMKFRSACLPWQLEVCRVVHFKAGVRAELYWIL